MEDQRQYCLKWNNHPRNVATVFDRLRQEELFVDVSLATSDRQIIRAHRCLLSAGSGYLEKVLAMNPSDHPTVVLSSVRYKDLKLLVDFMYSGEIAVDQQQFPTLLEAAKWLKIRGLYEDTDEVTDEVDSVPKEVSLRSSPDKSSSETSELSVTPNKRAGEDRKVHQVPSSTELVPSSSTQLVPSSSTQLVPSQRKRSRSEESEEELEVQSPISTETDKMEEDDMDTSFEDNSPAAKQFKPMYGHIQGVANAVWMMNQGNKQQNSTETLAEDQKPEKEMPDIPSLLNLTNRSPKQLFPADSQPSPTKPLLSPSSLNEQLLQAMQLCTNPYLNPMAAMQKPLDLLNTGGSPGGSVFNGSYPMMSKFKSSCLSPNSKMSTSCLLTSAPVRRYKQYSEESLQAALKEIMNGQSINRSSMKHNIPARTLRDWMKRLNIKSVFTHHSHGKEGGSSRSGSQDGDEQSLASISPEPGTAIDLGSLTSPMFGSSSNAIFSQASSVFPGMKLDVSATVKDEEEIDDDEDRTLEIDEGPLANNVTQIAQTAN